MFRNKKISKIVRVIQVLLLVVTPVLIAGQAQASFLTHRFVALKNPIAGSITDYTIGFRISTVGTLGSVQVQFCDDTPFFDTPCVAPPGFDITTATLTGQTGETGFSIDPSSTANNLVLTRTATTDFAVPVQFALSGVTNPSTPNNTTYARIMTYASMNTSGGRTDQGGAAFVTAGRFGTAAYVPPLLHFCVGVTVSSDCSTTTGDFAGFGDLSSTQVRSVTTQCAAATNDPTGYVIYSLGTTMTSGNHTIPASTIQNPSLPGVSQFGINLRDNNNPNNGQNASGAGSGVVMSDYNTPDLYMFNPGAAVAQATNATDYNVYTTTYITNVSADQAAGVYSTTITYMAVAQF